MNHLSCFWLLNDDVFYLDQFERVWIARSPRLAFNQHWISVESIPAGAKRLLWCDVQGELLMVPETPTVPTRALIDAAMMRHELSLAGRHEFDGDDGDAVRTGIEE